MTCSHIIEKKITLVLILFTLCCEFAVMADDDANARKVAATVELLGDEQSETRNKAHATLERMLEEDAKIATYLEAFKNHDDPEVATRISVLLQKQDERTLTLKQKQDRLLKLKEQNAKLIVLDHQDDGVIRLDLACEKMARSIAKNDAKHELKLTVINQLKEPIKIYTICSHSHKDEGGGNRKSHLKKLNAGATHACAKTWEKRYYVLTDMDDKALGLYLTGEKDAEIIVREVEAGAGAGAKP